jgi:hypothetical protein
MYANLGGCMSSVIPTHHIVRAENTRADHPTIPAPSFASAHDPFDLQNTQRPALEPRSDRRLSQVSIDISNQAEAITERFGNEATEPLAQAAATEPDR